MILRWLKAFVDDETGATAMEYALLGGLVASALIGGATLLGSNAKNTYTNLAANVK